MITSDRFFVTGGTLRPDAPSYVERQADRELLEALLRGEFCYVLTSRQMGKSSLMVRTAARLRASGQRVLILDLTAVGQNLTPEQWYRSLIDLAADQLDLDFDPYWQAHLHHGPMLRFLGALQSVAEPLVVFIDEIDSVQSLPFSTDELFAGIREYYNRRAQQADTPPLTFCLLGVAMPSDLIRDPRATPFNIGRRIELTDFTPAEAAPLVLGLTAAEGYGSVRTSPPPHSPTPGFIGSLIHRLTGSPTLPHSHTPTRLLNRVLYWTGGHPYLTQRLCEAVAAPDPGSAKGWLHGRPETLVDRVAFELFFAPGARKRDPNLHLVHERLVRSDGDVAAILDLYRRVLHGHQVRDEATNYTAARLQLAGIVRSDGHHLQSRNRIYARSFDSRWIAEHMPNAELRRQQAAFRQGLARAGAIAAVVISLVGGLAGVAANEAHEATELTHELSKTISQKDEALRKLGKAYAEIERERNRARREALRATDSEARERGHRQTAEAMRSRAQAASVLAEQGRRRALHLQTVAEQQRAENHERLVRVSVANGMRLADEGRPFEGLHWLVEALRLDDRDPARARAHRTRIDSLLRQAPSMRQAWNSGHRPFEIALSPDASRAVVASLAGEVRIWDTHTGAQVGAPLFLQPRQLALRFSPDGKLLLAATGASFQAVRTVSGIPLWPAIPVDNVLQMAELSPDGRYILTGDAKGLVCVWESATGRRVAGPLQHGTGVEGGVFSPDGKRFFTSEVGGRIQAWRMPDGARLPLTLRAPGNPLKISRDGRWLAAVGGVGALVFSAETGQLQMSIPGGHIHALEFGADSRQLVTASVGDVRVWDVERSQQMGKALRHSQYVLAAAFQPTGGMLTMTSDGAVRSWDNAGTETAVRLTNLAGPASLTVFHADGQQVLLARTEGLLQLWNLHERGPLLRSQRPVTQAPLAVSADTRRVLMEDTERRLVVHDVITGTPVGPPAPSEPNALALALDARGERFAASRPDRSIQCFETATGKPAGPPWRPGERVRRLEFTAGGRYLLAIDDACVVHLRDVTTGQAAMRPIQCQKNDLHVAVSDDGRFLAVSGSHYGVLLRTLGPKPVDRDLLHHHRLFVAFSPDGSRLLTASRDRSVQLWNTGTGAPQGPAVYHDSLVNYARFSPDGRTFVLCGENQSARVWGCDGTPRTPILRHTSIVRGAAFSPDGARLVTLTGDGHARLWDARTAEALTVSTPIGHSGGECRFSPDGRRVLITLQDGELHSWAPTHEARPFTTLAQFATAVTGQRLATGTGGGVIPAADAAVLWEQCRPRIPEIPRSDPKDDAERSRREAARLEPRGAWPAVAAHLDRAIAVSPGEVGLLLRRARARAEIGRYGDAADDLSLAMGLGSDGYQIHYERALLRLAAGDGAAYEAACRQMLDRFSQGTKREKDMTVWTCSFGGDSPENHARALALARALIALAPGNADFHHSLGVMLYRTGRYEDATTPLREAMRLRGEGESTLLYPLHLGLTLRQLGDFAPAEKLIEGARQQRERRFQASVELRRVWTDRVEGELIEAELRATARAKPAAALGSRPHPTGPPVNDP